jgi:16S rRNA (guanine527-N7)-methyltransferase
VIALPPDVAIGWSEPDRAALVHRLQAFVALVLRWNRSIQLTAANTATEVYDHHVLDSLAVVSHIGAGEQRVVDVGAGGGFPGVVLALARPNVRITSLEPIHKKQAFLATARRELAIDNFVSFAERDDAHRERADFVPYDGAVSRATFAIPEWLDRGLALVRPGGLVIAMEGRTQHPLPSATERIEYALGDRTRALLVRRRPDR